MAKQNEKTYVEQFAEKVIEKLKNNEMPWQKPWTPNVEMLPHNPTTGKAYRGGNRLWLSMLGSGRDPRWMTFLQAQAAGYKIKKGAKSVPIEFVSHHKKIDKTDENGNPVLGPDGKPEKETVYLERPIYKQSRVFNGEDIEGLPPLEVKEKMYDWEPHEKAEQILSQSGAVIKHDQADRAFYRPSSDDIHLPDKGQFAKADMYYATALHELSHWTGHESRLDRDLKNPFGSPEYAKEELRAEIGSWMLGQDIGIGCGDALPEMEAQHAAYLQSWIRAIEDDPLEIVRACRDAEKIKEYVLGLELEKEKEKEKANEIPDITPDIRGKRETVLGQDVLPDSDLSSEKMPSGDFALDTKNLLKQAVQEDINLTFKNDFAEWEKQAEDLTIGQLLDWTEETLAVSKVEPGLEKLEKACQDYAKDYSFSYPDLSNFKKEFFEKVEIEREKQKLMPEIPVVKDLQNLMQDTLQNRLIKPELRERIENLLAAQSPSIGNYIDTFVAVQKSCYTENGPAAGMSEISDKYYDFAQNLFKDSPQHEKSTFETNLLAVVEYQSSELNKSQDVEKAAPEITETISKDSVEKEVVGDKNFMAQADLEEREKIEAELAAQDIAKEKTYINVPYKERQEAKSLGAKWDAKEKSWFVAVGDSLSKFEKWMDKAVDKTMEAAKDKFQFVYNNYVAIRDVVTAKKARDVIRDAIPHMTTEKGFTELAGQAQQVAEGHPTYHELSECFSAVNEHVQSKEFKGPENIVDKAKELDPNCKQLATEKTYLNVPYAEKDTAKKLGARWDNAERSWFCPAGVDLKPLQKYMGPQIQTEKQKTLDPQREFAEKLEAFGFDLGGKLPIMDGQKHRVPLLETRGMSQRGLDGTYCLYDNDRPAGWAQDWTTGDKLKLVASGVELTPEEKEKQREVRQQRLQERAQEQMKQHNIVAAKAKDMWLGNDYASLDHPYLEKKGIAGFDGLSLRCDTDNKLMIPIVDKNYEIRGLQFITEDGNKTFQPGMDKKGNFAFIGQDFNKHEPVKDILICEGFATGASLHQATGLPVIVALDAYNLEPVAQNIREIHPDSEITICADNDHNKVRNTGMEQAEKTAQSLGGPTAKINYILPVFTPEERSQGLTDFNDLQKSRGLGEVKKQFETYLAIRKEQTQKLENKKGMER